MVVEGGDCFVVVVVGVEGGQSCPRGKGVQVLLPSFPGLFFLAAGILEYPTARVLDMLEVLLVGEAFWSLFVVASGFVEFPTVG